MTPDIKIFVSHRIDMAAELIDNPIYVPVRCGAVKDDKNLLGIAGDNTGVNISERDKTFNELTVQYWAWKNVKADYYGLCHYRRYLVFSDRRFHVNNVNQIKVPVITPRAKRKYGLLDYNRMAGEIAKYDMVVAEYADVHKLPAPNGVFRDSIGELWAEHDGMFFEKKYLDILMELIERLAPEYKTSAREYFAGSRHRGYNCFVMKKELFDRLCRFQFPILFEIERILAASDTSSYTNTMKRTPGFMGEILFGIFTYHVSEHEHIRVKETQFVYFEKAGRITGTKDLIKRNLLCDFDAVSRVILEPLFPIGSKRRKKLAATYKKLRK